ncbi:hypothetical protein K457DRAFT_12838 [Linnemannia elongata AG-77]|uniref:Uncharacterized protein n=1 Tax=Linnemannia elongata AG-77 TaxID=1314771 RepID=A0A197KF48_9FUNG|nr:hypothetical protein K457DRAFT_12838 [Linnemannia elongata AG-77]
MGWFSKSSSTTPVEHPKQEDTTPAAATPAAATTSTTTAEEPVAEVKAAPAAPVVAAYLPAMEFDEYKQPDDIYARFQVSDAMNELAACSSLGSNIRNYYRYGTFKDCAARYDHLKFCLSIKTKSSQVAQVMIQKRDADLRAHKKSQPNSEDVWSLRS